jgi:predicted transcriptional regulator of viral defense system
MVKKAPHPSSSRFKRALNAFRQQGGLLRTSEAMRAGVHPATLYALRDAGTIELLSRGLYRLGKNPPLSNPDLLLVARRIPQGVVCLLSALQYHDLTTQIPHEVYVALPPGAWKPRLAHPPVRVFHFTGKALTEGVETHTLDGVAVRVYDPEKTLADCFKFRNRIGLDTVMEALKFYRERRRLKVDALMRYAALCRVARIMRPYLEATL